MKKLILIPVLYASIFLLGAAAAVSAQEPDFRVGVVLPLSGANAFGEGIRQGCELAREHISKGLKLKRNLSVIYEDDQYDPTKTLSAMQKLISVNNIDAAITVSSGPSRVSIPLIEKKQIPLIAIATNDGFTEGTDFVYSLWTLPQVEAGALFQEAKRRGYRRLARIGADNPVFAELDRNFDLLNRNQFEIVFDQRVVPNDNDFHAIIAKLKKVKDLDAIMVNLLPPPSTGLFARQARAAGLKQDLFGAEVFEAPDAIKASQGALEGQWYASSADPSPDFAREFKSRFPDSMLIGAANCHDALMLIAAALKERSSPLEVNAYLRSVKSFSGALGVFSADGKGAFILPAGIREVVGLGYKQIGVYEGIH